MLTGQAKTDYQREYMRRLRAKNKDSAVIVPKRALKNTPDCPVLADVRPVRPKLPIQLDLDNVRPVVVRPELTKERQVSRKGFNE